MTLKQPKIRTHGAKAQQQLDWIIKDFVSMPHALESGRLCGLVGMVLHGELTVAPRDWANFQRSHPNVQAWQT